MQLQSKITWPARTASEILPSTATDCHYYYCCRHDRLRSLEWTSFHVYNVFMMLQHDLANVCTFEGQYVWGNRRGLQHDLALSLSEDNTCGVCQYIHSLNCKCTTANTQHLKQTENKYIRNAAARQGKGAAPSLRDVCTPSLLTNGHFEPTNQSAA